MSDGKTPYERRFGEPCKGPVIPVGSMVEYHPISAKDQSRLHQFGKKVSPGTFLGYALYARSIWKGDILIADIEELEIFDTSEVHARRLNAKKSSCRKNDENFRFQIADGTVELSGRDHGIRKSTVIRDQHVSGEELRGVFFIRVGRVPADRRND